MNTIWIVLPILTLLMFDLGLSLRFEDFGKVFRHPWPIAVALFGQLILLPAIALGLAYLFHLSPVFFIGLVLMLLPVLLGIGLHYAWPQAAEKTDKILSRLAFPLLSRLVKNDTRQRRTVLIEVGMQNAAQAIAIASSPLIFANEEMAIPAILYSLMMNIVLLTYVGIVRKRNTI